MEKVSQTDPSTSYMISPDSFGTLLHKHCIKIFGEEFNEWESDTIIISLRDKFGMVPDINVDKILAIVGLINSMDGKLCFFNEIHCFRHTVNALNSKRSDYDFMGYLIPQHIHWAIYEIGLLYPEYKLNEEPLKFLAMSYHDVGSLVLPEDLEEYQEFLDRVNHNSELAPKIMEHWKLHKEKKVDDFDEDNVVHMQMLMLKCDEMYMTYRKNIYQKHLSMLN